jgi:hypothetical protein
MLIVWPKLVSFSHTCAKGGYKKNRVEKRKGKVPGAGGSQQVFMKAKVHKKGKYFAKFLPKFIHFLMFTQNNYG